MDAYRCIRIGDRYPRRKRRNWQAVPEVYSIQVSSQVVSSGSHPFWLGLHCRRNLLTCRRKCAWWIKSFITLLDQVGCRESSCRPHWRGDRVARLCTSAFARKAFTIEGWHYSRDYLGFLASASVAHEWICFHKPVTLLSFFQYRHYLSLS
jgi:hypothetical protein